MSAAVGQAPERMTRVTIRQSEVGDPTVEIYHFVLENHEGTWPETFGSREQAESFLRGVKAATVMAGGRSDSIPSSVAEGLDAGAAT